MTHLSRSLLSSNKCSKRSNISIAIAMYAR